MPSKTITCFLVCLIGTSPGGWAQSARYRCQQSDDPEQDRNAYLLALLSVDPRAREAIVHNRVLQDLGGRLTKIRQAVYAASKGTKACPVDQLS